MLNHHRIIIFSKNYFFNLLEIFYLWGWAELILLFLTSPFRQAKMNIEVIVAKLNNASKHGKILRSTINQKEALTLSKECMFLNCLINLSFGFLSFWQKNKYFLFVNIYFQGYVKHFPRPKNFISIILTTSAKVLHILYYDYCTHSDM